MTTVSKQTCRLLRKKAPLVIGDDSVMNSEGRVLNVSLGHFPNFQYDYYYEELLSFMASY